MNTDYMSAAEGSGALQGITDWIASWQLPIQALGGAVLLICVMLIATKGGVKAVSNSQGGTRETISGIGALTICGFVLGLAMVVFPLVIRAGKATNGTTPADGTVGAPAAITAPAVPGTV